MSETATGPPAAPVEPEAAKVNGATNGSTTNGEAQPVVEPPLVNMNKGLFLASTLNCIIV